MFCDPIEVTRNLLAYKFARFWALPLVQRLRRGGADRGHRPAQAGDDFSNRNQLAAFALHGFILPQLAAPVYWRKPIVFCTVRGTEINR